MRRNKRQHCKPLIITDHAAIRYLERHGREPRREELAEALRHAACAQRSMVMRYLDGRPWIAPGVYINFDQGLALLLDEIGPVDKVVTILTRANQC